MVFETSYNEALDLWPDKIDEESHGVFSEEVLLHYNVISSNNIIDIVSSHPPVVKRL